MSEHFKYTLNRRHREINFQIQEQSDEFENFLEDEDGVLVHSEDVKVLIRSVMCPEIVIVSEETESEELKVGDIKVYVRGGWPSSDDKIASVKLNSEAEADKYLNIIDNALQSAIEAFEESLLE